MKSILLFIVMVMVTTTAFAIPQLINYQGFLTDIDDTPLETNVSIVFAIYSAPSGGSVSWTETHSAVLVSNGMFNVLLGSVTPLPDLFGTNRYLGIRVNTDTEMIPRQQIVSVAHAYRVGTVDGASGGTISGELTVGSNNTNQGFRSYVFGDSNGVFADFVTVAGGRGNGSDSNYGFVGGGYHNSVNNSYGVVAGGQDNHTDGTHNFIGGGANNHTTGNNSGIAAGSGNEAGFDAFVGGGIANTASGQTATIGGGDNNVGSGVSCTIGGGFENQAIGNNSTVSGGQGNSAEGDFSIVSGGASNVADTIGTTISGGQNNLARGVYSTVSGGSINRARGNYSTVSGGGGASLADSNSAMGIKSTIGGGSGNLASDTNSTVGGGKNNLATAEYATIGGGRFNRARGNYSTVSGGGGPLLADSNSATGSQSAIGGGADNHAGGLLATIPGGNNNIANGTNSFAAGRSAHATHDGSFVWGCGPTDTDSWGANTFTARAFGGARFYSSVGSAGVELTPGGGSWASLCDKNQKNFHGDVNTSDVLQKVSSLPLHKWSYKSQNESIQHIGPTAQDFHSTFGLGDNNTTISTLDPDGVALAAIQELAKRNEELREELARQAARHNAELAELKSLVNQLIQLGNK